MGTQCDDRYLEYRVCDALRELRRRRGLTRRAVSDQIGGITWQALQAWEEGIAFPNSLRRLQDWARALDVSLELVIKARDGSERRFF